MKEAGSIEACSTPAKGVGGAVWDDVFSNEPSRRDNVRLRAPMKG